MKTNQQTKEELTGFWGGEQCEYCQGTIVEKRVSLSRQIKGKYILIENVPAGVCTQCGTGYFSANVLKAIEETTRSRQIEREITASVYSFS